MSAKELKTLRDKCLLFNQFMMEGGYFTKELTGAFTECNRLIETAYEKGNLKSLKSMSNDIDNQVTKCMPISMALELKIFFKDKLDADFEAVDRARLKAIGKVLKRGEISNPAEYELIIGRVDEIYEDSDKSKEIKCLNEVLAAFDKKQSN